VITNLENIFFYSVDGCAVSQYMWCVSDSFCIHVGLATRFLGSTSKDNLCWHKVG